MLNDNPAPLIELSGEMPEWVVDLGMETADIIAHLKAWLTSLPEGHPVTEKIKELIELTEQHAMEEAIGAIADKHKDAMDNAHYNLLAVGEARVVVKDGNMNCERVTFNPTIMAVPIDEWNALQEELKQLRQNQK